MNVVRNPKMQWMEGPQLEEDFHPGKEYCPRTWTGGGAMEDNALALDQVRDGGEARPVHDASKMLMGSCPPRKR